MKYVRIFAFLSIALIFASCSNNTEVSSQSSASIAEDEVNQVLDKWIELWATYDLNMLDKIFYNSEDLTYFSSEKEGLIKGYDEMTPHHVGFGFLEGGKTPEKELWLEEVDIRLYGESALVGAVWYFGDREAEKDSVANGPVTFVLLKNKEGDARIIHTHFANY